MHKVLKGKKLMKSSISNLMSNVMEIKDFPDPPQAVHQKAKVAVSHFGTPSFRRSLRRATRREAVVLLVVPRRVPARHVSLEIHCNICSTIAVSDALGEPDDVRFRRGKGISGR